jgi:hypothetical protein
MSKGIDIRRTNFRWRMGIVADVGIALVVAENDDDVRFVFRQNNGRYSAQAED